MFTHTNTHKITFKKIVLIIPLDGMRRTSRIQCELYIWALMSNHNHSYLSFNGIVSTEIFMLNIVHKLIMDSMQNSIGTNPIQASDGTI